MKTLRFFYLKKCPYCRQAIQWMEALRMENPAYMGLAIQWIEESEEAALADSFDYYYVPCYFLEGKKLHEGAATKEKIQAVLEEYINAC